MRDESELLRNRTDVPKEHRDSDAILSRFENFWKSHELSREMLGTRGGILGKGINTSDLGDGDPLEHSGGVVGFEGSGHPMMSVGSWRPGFHALFKEVYDQPNPSALSRAALRLTPHSFMKTRGRGYNETLTYTGNTSMDSNGTWSRPAKKDDNRSFWDIHNEEVSKSRKDFEEELVTHSDALNHLEKFHKRYNLSLDKHYGKLPNTDIEFESPRYLRVNYMDFPRNNIRSSWDVIDLGTGSWARLNRDEFFPFPS